MKKPVLNKILIAAVALLALVPGVASAATDAFTIYAYGSGNVLRQIFEGMKGFVDDPGYRRMVQVLVLLTLIYVMVKGYLFNRPSPIPIVGLVVGVFMLQILLFSDGARTEIHIEDQVHAEDYLVSDMPIALAAPAAFTSEVSRYMVKLVETFYMGPSIPIEMRMSENNTYNFANKIISALRTTTISDPMTKATFNSYIRECVVPEMYQGRIRLDTLLEAPPDQFWGSLFANNKARMSICFQHCAGMNPNDPCPAQPANGCPDPYINTGALSSTLTAKDWREGLMVACDAGHPALQRRIEALIGATAFNELGNTLLRDSSLLDGAVSSTILHITGVTGATGTEHFMRAGMMNMFRESSASVIANGGSPGLIQVLGTEQAKAVQRTNWMVAADVFAESVAYLWSTLQAFIFAIFPIAVFLFLFPGLGPKALAGYFGLLAWISLWMPFLAVINFLSISWLVEDIRQLAMTNLSYASLLPISDAAANMQSITNFLGTMVPVLTYGMVRGGEFALTQFAGDASAPRASESASAQIASKSFNYGSISANNVGMNKFDGTTSFAAGYDATTYKDGVGAGTYLRPESIATTTKAGSPETVTTQATVANEKGQAGSFSMSSGQQFTNDASSVSAVAASAKAAISNTDTNSQARSKLSESSQALSEARNEQKAAQLQYSDQASRALTAESGLDARGAMTAKGALVLGSMVGMIGAEGLNPKGFTEGGDREIAKQLAAEGGGSVMKALNDRGFQFGSEKEALDALSVANQTGVSMQKYNPSMTAAEAQAGATALGLTGLSDENLDKLASSQDGKPAVLTPQLREKIGALKEEAEGSLGKDALAAIGGGIMGAGATVGALLTKMVPGVSNVIEADGALTQSGGTGMSVSSDNKTSGSFSSGDLYSFSRSLGDVDRYAEATTNTRQAAVALSSTIDLAASNTNGLRASKTDTGATLYQATETTSEKEGLTQTATMVSGTLDALSAGATGGTLVSRSQDPEGTRAAMRGDLGRSIEEAKTRFEGNKAAVGDPGKGTPSTPDMPVLGSGTAAKVDSGQQANRGSNTIAEPSTSGPNDRGMNKVSDRGAEANRAMAATAAMAGSYYSSYGDQIGSLKAGGQNVSRFADDITMKLGSASGSAEAVAASQGAAGGAKALVASARVVEDQVDSGGSMGFNGINTSYMVDRGGGYFKINDSSSGSSFNYTPAEGGGYGQVSAEGRNNFGAFLKGSNADLIGEDANRYKNMSDDEAVRAYDQKFAR